MSEFEIPGPPVAKQRPRRGPAGNWYTPQRTKDFEEQVAWCAKAAGVELKEGPCKVEIDFHLSARRRDIDNLAKSVLDGMNGINGWDDRQVVALNIRTVDVKDGSEEKTVVRVR